jgi:Lactate racemase N-terminal domain
VPRIPLLSGSRLLIVSAPDDAVILTPPAPPATTIVDVPAAVRDALRFPLDGPALDRIVTRGGRVTVVVEQATLPLPGAPVDPRRPALEATLGELERLGVPHEKQTILVACGLARRPRGKELAALVSPRFARTFHGQVVVHDVEDEGLVELGEGNGVPLRASSSLVETDAVVIVTAAESVLHGGPAALLGAGGAEALRAANAESLLQTSGSSGWQLALAMERAVAARVPLIGLSLTLDRVRVADTAYGYPHDPASLERIARSPFTRLFQLLPGPVRMRALKSLPQALGASATYAGRPSVAHAEALLRSVELRSATLDRPLDAICLGIPRSTPHLPRERPNPLLATYLGLGLALRMWRDEPVVAPGGTAILVHRFHRHFTHPTQQPYRAFFAATRAGPDPEAIAAAEEEARTDERSIDAYRGGHGCHPLLPFADWAGCQPQLGRLGEVLIAACRDSAAARQLGFVPTHAVGAALEMATGVAGGPPRIGFLLAPPYFPVRVGS